MLSEEDRRTLDATPAAEFYRAPRIGVQHADDAFLKRLQGEWFFYWFCTQVPRLKFYNMCLATPPQSYGAFNALIAPKQFVPLGLSPAHLFMDLAHADLYTEVLSSLPPLSAAQGLEATMQLPQGWEAGEQLPQRSLAVLDLCSSWTSHVPSKLAGRLRVIGHGINEDELKVNSRLASWFVQVGACRFCVMLWTYIRPASWFVHVGQFALFFS